MGAPDEAETRAWVTATSAAPREGRLSLAGEFADAFGTIPAAADGLWAIDDFRPSEADRYDGLLSAATVRVRRLAEVELLDAVIEALIAFAMACPDPGSHAPDGGRQPRARRGPGPALSPAGDPAGLPRPAT